MDGKVNRSTAWPATGLIYPRNRWYDPRLGQFLSHDPQWYGDGFNLYEYAAGDPINDLDPFGAGAADTRGIPEFDPARAQASRNPEVAKAIESNWLQLRSEYYAPSMTSPRQEMDANARTPTRG